MCVAHWMLHHVPVDLHPDPSVALENCEARIMADPAARSLVHICRSTEEHSAHACGLRSVRTKHTWLQNRKCDSRLLLMLLVGYCMLQVS